MVKKVSTSLWLVLCFYVYAQERQTRLADSLSKKSYDYFIERLDSEGLPPTVAEVYRRVYLARAKSEKNFKEQVNAYKYLLHESKSESRIYYADSMIWAARHTHEKDLIGSAYLTKGIVYYDRKNYSGALDNYLLADNYLSNTKDDYLKYKVKYNIAQIKYYLGFYSEAIKLFSECIQYYQNKEAYPYLTSLHSLGQAYNRMGRHDLCSLVNKRGIAAAEAAGQLTAIPRFTHSEGINQYWLKNYSLSIAKLQEALPTLTKSGDFANEAVTYFYIGKNLWAMGQPEKAVPYFLKVDKIVNEQNYIRPDLRENYELLINYYKGKNDLKGQLIYINRLLQVDRYLDANYNYLSERIHKEYDNKKLLKAKDEISRALLRREQLNNILLTAICVLVVVIGYLIYRAVINKRKFNQLLARQRKPMSNADKSAKPLDINPAVVAQVLKHLEKFEASEKYLAKDLTLPKLAKMFDSNTVYVSRIISHYKEKKSIDYINDLKIEYIINLLKTNQRFRNYTNKALSEEAGFNTTQHFTRAFFKNTGISPTYFVEQLKKTTIKETLK